MDGLSILFSAAQIAARVDALALEIDRAIPGDFVMVGLLKGAAVFVADLARALDRAGARPEIEFMRLSSYGFAKESSGTLQLLGDVPAGLLPLPPPNCARAASVISGFVRCSTSRSGGGSRSRSISSASQSATCLWWATAPTMPRNTATYPTSAPWTKNIVPIPSQQVTRT